MAATGQNATFFQEAEELLLVVESAALALEHNPTDADVIGKLFRALHTIKGSAGMAGLDVVAAFTHHVESALDMVRGGKASVTPALITTVLSARDHIEALLTAARSDEEAPTAAATSIIESLAQLCPVRVTPSDASPAAPAPPATNFRTHFKITYRPDPMVFRNGIEPANLLEDLHALGPCRVVCLTDRLPGLHELVPDRCDLGWEITLVTAAGETAVRDVFVFVEQDSELSIDRGLTEFETDPPPSPVHALTGAPIAQAEEASSRRAAGARAAASAQSTVRVTSERLDKLVNLVGELVINQARLQQAHVHSDKTELAGPVEAMERLIAELRDSVFGIRMMPIGTTFGRFQRVVRDVAAQLDKDIVLHTEGAETELDKTVLDQLGDPLVHLIRNSIDHGIELPAARVAAGKPRQGNVRLGAAHDGGSVVITIEDDGRGLDRAAIRAKAEQQGLVEPGAVLSEQETFDLIMRPGFSTATSVTQLSGRGVGMDVVKKTLESLRGSLHVSSVQGQGTTMRLTLPLTLAIIDGLLVEVQGDRFIVPMSAVTENVELERAKRTANNGRNLVTVREELVPYVRLRELYSMSGMEPEIEKVVIVSVNGERVGLVVDRVIGSHQTVIQPLSRICRAIDLFSGTTIMGDGRVAMILDLNGTLRRVGDDAGLDYAS